MSQGENAGVQHRAVADHVQALAEEVLGLAEEQVIGEPVGVIGAANSWGFADVFIEDRAAEDASDTERECGLADAGQASEGNEDRRHRERQRTPAFRLASLANLVYIRQTSKFYDDRQTENNET